MGTPTVTRILPLLTGHGARRKLLFSPFSGAEPQRELMDRYAALRFAPNRHQGLDRIYFTTVRDGRFVPMDERQWRAWQR